MIRRKKKKLTDQFFYLGYFKMFAGMEFADILIGLLNRM